MQKQNGEKGEGKFKPFLPLIITESVSSLADKMIEHGVLTRMQWEYQQGIIFFTETWLQEQVSHLSFHQL